jgi:hypothetical protein
MFFALKDWSRKVQSDGRLAKIGQEMFQAMMGYLRKNPCDKRLAKKGCP